MWFWIMVGVLGTLVFGVLAAILIPIIWPNLFWDK